MREPEGIHRRRKKRHWREALSRGDHLVFIPLHYTGPSRMGHRRGRMTGHYAFMKIICSSGTSRVGNWAEIVLIVINHV